MFKVGDVVTEPIESPLRTVTRREIVPGIYGIVRVFKDGAVFVDAMPAPSPESLREAAHILNQLAEVLEENK